MIPTKTQITTEGNLGGTSTAMTIRAEDMQHIMGVVTDLYSNKALAILREYSTNAADAHREAGITRPIEVTLPSAFASNLVIRDFGTGMNTTDLTETFGMFGRSTKRGSNEFNGCLGLGSKSALTYGATFTVTSIKDGVRSEVVVFRDENGVGQLTVVDTRATDEANGTTVTIPTDPSDQFRDLAADFYKVWRKGSVLVNGKEPRHISADKDLTPLDDGLVYWKPSNSGSSWRQESVLRVVMGGVTYRQVMDSHTRFQRAIDVTVFVPLGAVDFVPSREALQVSPRVKKFLDDKWSEIGDLIANDFTARLSTAKTLREAVKTFIPMQQMLGVVKGVKWRGIELTTQTAPGGREWRAGYNAQGEGQTSAMDRNISLSALYSEETAILVNRESRSSFNALDKHRVADYIRSNHLDYRRVLFLGDYSDPIYGEVHTLDWNKIKSHSASPAAAKSTGPSDTWSILKWDGKRVQRSVGTVPTTGQVLFLSSTEYIDGWRNVDANVLKHLPAGTSLLEVAKNRQEKFVRENPKAQHLFAYVDAMVAAVQLTADEREAAAMGVYSVRNEYKDFVGKTDDKRIDTLYAAALSAMKKVTHVNEIASLTLREQVAGRRTKSSYLGLTYPLAHSNHIDHSVAYINLIHKNGK